jgi:DNA gyrase subunit B
VLTLMFREMPELIEAGYVYIAKPPLYKLKRGNQTRYIERESELEGILLSDKWEKLDIRDRDGGQFKLTEARWQKLTRLLKQYEGWASALRAEYGHDLVSFLEESALLDSRVDTDEAAVAHIERGNIPGVPYETSLLDQDETEIRVRAVETRSGLARTHRIRRALFTAPEYRALVKIHHQLIELTGQAPFAVTLADQLEEAMSFEELRDTVLEVARKGVGVQRFKGLGEMNPDQLRETTMDPANRTLARVTVDDAAAADRIFSMLMGDQVEPRREFIESNARAVANLDV